MGLEVSHVPLQRESHGPGPVHSMRPLGLGRVRDYHLSHLPRRFEEGRMRIEIKGRNLTVGDELTERVGKKFAKIGRQVSELAELEIELKEERNPSIREACVAEATLHLKGTTLRACEHSDDMAHSVNLLAEDLHRQVKRHRDKRRGRREATRAQPQPGAP